MNNFPESDKNDHLAHVQEIRLLAEGGSGKDSPPFSMWRSVCVNLLKPVPLASILAIGVGLVPGVREVFYEEGSAGYLVTEVGLTIGMAGIFMGQASLGASLVLVGMGRSEFSKGFIASVVGFKCVVMPLASLGIVYGIWKIGVLGENIVMMYVIFIGFCCPSALATMIIAQLFEYAVHEVAILMIWIYGFAVASLVIFSYAFFMIFI